MTCVIGIINSKTSGIVMGSDSQKTLGSTIVSDFEPKIWTVERYDKEWVFGEAGNVRHLQLCRYAFQWPEKHKRTSNLEFLILDFIPSLKILLKENQLLKTKEGVDSTDASLLVGVEGILYEIDGLFGVDKISLPYWAIGSGKLVALGSLASTQDLRGWDDERRAEKALSLASDFCTGVSAPFHYRTI